jgi:hypothetical protein
MKFRRLGLNVSKGWSKANEDGKPKIPDVHRSQVKRFNHPLILRITIAILIRPQSMRYSFDGVHDRTSKVVCWVNLPFVAGITICTLI